MKKIQLIFTGGTIMSLQKQEGLNVDGQTKYMLLEKALCPEENFEIASPFCKLSENFTLDDVFCLYQQVLSCQKKDVKGIIILHGTDSLACTAPYLALMLQKCKKKIVLVSSNFPLDNPAANGVENFKAALKIIEDDRFTPAVYVAYKNPCDNFLSVHYASRLPEPLPLSDCFYAQQNRLAAKIEGDKISFISPLPTLTRHKFKLEGTFKKRCLQISSHTGLDYQIFSACNFDYALQTLYHSGTANALTENDSHSALWFANECKKMGKELFFCNIQRAENYYATTNLLAKKQATMLYNILPNVALAKVNIAQNFIATKKERDRFSSSNIAGEILD